MYECYVGLSDFEIPITLCNVINMFVNSSYREKQNKRLVENMKNGIAQAVIEISEANASIIRNLEIQQKTKYAGPECFD